MTRTVDFGTCQHQGARTYQEDVYALQALGGGEGVLLVLADGMGGHAGGREAASAAVEAASAALGEGLAPPRLDLGMILAASDKAVKRLHKTQPALSEGGCTFVAARLSGGSLDWISVGDSPLYLVSAGSVQRLNADHSMAPVLRDLVASGRLDASELATHPQRNALRSCLGSEPIALIDASAKPLPLHPGEVVILASDGLDTLSDAEIADLVMEVKGGMAALALRLVEAVVAKKKPNQDNVSVLCASLSEGAEPERTMAAFSRRGPERRASRVVGLTDVQARRMGLLGGSFGLAALAVLGLQHCVSSRNPTADTAQSPGSAEEQPAPQAPQAQGSGDALEAMPDGEPSPLRGLGPIADDSAPNSVLRGSPSTDAGQLQTLGEEAPYKPAAPLATPLGEDRAEEP